MFNVSKIDNTSVIRQKSESQNEGFKKTKHAKFSDNSQQSHIAM